MATLENFKDMYDVALKPRILRTLLKEDIPDENNIPFDSPWKLSRVVSCIQTHKLLSESITEAMDSKQIQRWKSAVDEWVNRLLSLITNTTTTMPDKCWAGICLLGLTCKECSAGRFLSSHAVWFDNLLLHIQSPSDSQFVKVACCTSISDLITRLAGFPNAKKDGTSHAGKLIQHILKLLKENNSEAVWEGAIHLLCAVITFFPASVHRHYDSVEAVITSNIFSGKCSVNVMKKLAHCLALLPKSRGDGDSWLLMMRNILLLVNGYLTEIFHGLEEETKWDEAVRLLVPPGEAPPPSLWGEKLLEETSDKERRRSKLSNVSMLMLSCCTMLTNSYPVQVTVPIRSLLVLVGRVLMVNGSLPHAMSSFVILADQEFICSELPVMHAYCLELLASVIKGMRSQLLPHAAYTVRLVKEYFRRCELPELRIKVYSITKILLISMGVGIAMYLAQEVVNNSLLDLNPIVDDTTSGANIKASSEALLQPFHRKRKHGATGSLEQQLDRIGLEADASKNYPTTPISVKIAALEALEALLTVGGALRSESWRPKVDDLLITIAADSCKGGWANEERNMFLPSGPSSTCADFQLAALHALLASLLSPSRTRPPHLARALELFQRGRQETRTKLSEFCAYALLALEVLIHPRALPLAGLPSANSFQEVTNRFPETMYSGGQNQNTTFSRVQGIGHGHPELDDDLYESWLDTINETEAPVDSLAKNMDTKNHSETMRVQLEKEIFVSDSLGAKIPGRNEHEPKAAGADVEMERYGDEMVVKSQQFRESSVQPEESSKVATIPAVTGDPEITKTSLASNTSALDSTDNKMGLVDAIMADGGDELATRGGKTSLNAKKSVTSIFESDNDSSSDSFPDIVDADPDSD